MAPGIGLLASGCALIVLAILLTTPVVSGVLEEAAVLSYAVEALAVLLGLILAVGGHRSASQALARDPGLRGAFFARHAWWMTALAAMAAMVLQVPLMWIAYG